MIETLIGPIESDSPFQKKGWVWGADGIHAIRSRLDDTVVITSERGSSVEFDDNTENQYIPPPP